jgi:hypothetical protein
MIPDDLINRYLEDRLALSAVELDELIALLKAQPARAAAVCEQLILDDLLAQKLAVDRRNFPAQVAQRLADFERGQQELDEQVSELRQLAEAEIERPQTWSGNSPWVKYVLALAAAGLIGGVFFVTQWLPGRPQLVAKVTAVSGDVTIQASGKSAAAAIDASLLTGQEIVVPAGGQIDIAYQDATTLRVGGGSAVTLEIDRATGGKRVALARGELQADISPQTAAAMTFTTPHAVATVLGTRLRLVVDRQRTLLDVLQGQVQLDPLTGGVSKIVSASNSGVAEAGQVQVSILEWPPRHDALAYLLSPLESTPEDGLPYMAVRNPQTGQMLKTDLVPQGAAELLPGSLHWQLDGGHLRIEEPGVPDLFAALAGASELTLEVVFTPAAETQSAARLVAWADDGEPANFALSQEGRELTFSLAGVQPGEPLRIPLADSTGPQHLAIAFRPGELVAYLDGAEVASSKEVRGAIADWRTGLLSVGADSRGDCAWRGQVQALALYRRCLTADEVQRSAASYRLLRQ